MEKKSIFRQESLDRVSSPEQLDEYIKVAKPGIWIVIISFIILTISVIVWGVMGTLPKTLTVDGLLLENNGAVCYIGVAAVSRDITGCNVQIVTADGSSLAGKVSSVSPMPLSSAEIVETLHSDWTIEKLVNADYSYAVMVDIAGESAYKSGVIATVTLITDEVRPISFILN